MNTKSLAKILLATLIAQLAPSVAVAEAILEINQICASQLGCFSGDLPGYPVTLDGSAGHSYRLTSNLVVPNIDTHGIEVTSNHTSINLNGFAVIGVGCVGQVNNCTPASGTGSGVHVTNPSPSRGETVFTSGVSVKNGSIIGMGEYGVFLRGRYHRAEGLRLRWNRSDGIVAGFGAKITDNVAFGNGRFGINASSISTVSGNSTYNNGGSGISIIQGSVFQNTSYLNGGDGITIPQFLVGGSIVQGNTVRFNSGYGLNLSAESAYSENIITANTAGTVLGGISVDVNFCDTSSFCP